MTKTLLKKSGDDLLYLWLNAVPSAQAERGGLTATHFFTLQLYTKKEP